MTKELEQKRLNTAILDKLTAIEDLLWKSILLAFPKTDRAATDVDAFYELVKYLDKAELAKECAEALGLRSHLGSITIRVDDWQSSIQIECIPAVKKDFINAIRPWKAPGLSKALPYIKKSGYRAVAERFNSSEEVKEVLDIWLNNVSEAERVGDTKLLKVFKEEVVIWTGVHKASEWIDYKDLALQKQAEADPALNMMAEQSDRYKDEFGIYLPSLRGMFDLFSQFGETPKNDLVWVFVHYVAANVLEYYNTTFDQYLKEEQGEFDKKTEEYKIKYLKKDGFRKSLSYRQRELADLMKDVLDKDSTYIHNLIKYENEIKKAFDGIKVRVSASVQGEA